MQIILLSRIKQLGNVGDVVEVKNGYGRNYLIPSGYAKQATTKNLAWLETVKGNLERIGNEKIAQAEVEAAKLDDVIIDIVREADEEGNLYGAIRVAEVLKAAEVKTLSITKQQISFATQIRKIGLHEVTITFHPSVIAKLTCQVTRH